MDEVGGWVMLLSDYEREVMGEGGSDEDEYGAIWEVV